MLIAIQKPRRAFRLDKGRQFHLEQDGKAIFDLSDCMKWKKLHFTLNGREHHSYLQQGQYGLKSGNDVLLSPVARLKRMGFMRYGFECRVGDDNFILRSRFLKRGCDLIQNRNLIGFIRPKKPFSPNYNLNLPNSMDLIAQIFLFWLVVEILPPPLDE